MVGPLGSFRLAYPARCQIRPTVGDVVNTKTSNMAVVKAFRLEQEAIDRLEESDGKIDSSR